ncbi:DUF6873 family GME fold protein [Abyssisolibacter fermentans]|uniref:DUF6873 family GME fold protein n=1 Tax=Abyssisolibacter fermentans TaxID=1766203 RepID=UPI00082B455D|nr:hypothetical protein [Abyssisolibacter fermentans]
MENPFLMNKKADLLIVDARVDESIISNLKKYNVEIIKTIECKDILEPVAYHPDMVIHPVNHNTIVVAPNVYDYYKEVLFKKPINIIKGEKLLNRNYPEDIAYNVARVWKYAVHKVKNMDPKLKFYLLKEGLEFIDVNQGYSKCSTAIIADKAVITSDNSIYKALIKQGIDVLHIQEGYIDLLGFDYGFIGGATSCIGGNDVILFSGDYTSHSDKLKINNFIKKNRKSSKILSDKKIIDIGSIITLRYN